MALWYNQSTFAASLVVCFMKAFWEHYKLSLPLKKPLKPNFKVKENPLPWLEWVLNGADHTNFFENRVTEYEVAGLTGTWDDAYEDAA